ncbi:MAG: efflux RND transporter periplasmic adaptor subunit, partial [Planctomycetes bacterium]|nr:efflux RND transporter periplasmic adaptor subunit [Planctomycetota bacterium]
GGGISVNAYIRDKKTSVKYRTETIKKGDILAVVTATGTINPVTTVQVGSQVSGIIEKIFVDFNSVVKAGDIVAQIDPVPFQTKVEQAKANLSVAEASVSAERANIEKAEVAVEDTKRTLKRLEELLQNKVVSQAEKDTAQANYDSAVAQLEANRAQHELAVAQLAQAKAALKSAELDLSHTVITSPVDGIVLSRNVDVGQTVIASFQTPTMFLIAQDLTKMEVHGNVSESDIGMVAVGEDATFIVDAYPAMTFNGKVTQVRNASIVIQNVVTYDVVIGVENIGLKLKPGMTANVSINVAQKENILKIPNAAVRFKPVAMVQSSETPEEKSIHNKHHVYIPTNDGDIKAVPVELGISDDNSTELVKGDLKEGDKVIVGVLSEGAKSSSASTPRRMYP